MSGTFTIRFMTRTAILLALALVFQIFGKDVATALLIPPMYQSFLVGPLVNLCLLVATAFVGVWSGGVVAVLTPFSAFLIGQVTEPLFTPVIALGNLILVLVFALAVRKSESGPAGCRLAGRVVGILFGSLLKTAWLWGGITAYFSLFTVQPAVRKVMGFAFSWPQLVTGLAGGVLALLVLGLLDKAVSRTK